MASPRSRAGRPWWTCRSSRWTARTPSCCDCRSPTPTSSPCSSTPTSRAVDRPTSTTEAAPTDVPEGVVAGRSSLGSVPRLSVPPKVALPVPASSSKPRASLGRVLDDLGATLLDLVHGDPGAAEEIGGVVIHDPVDIPVLPHRALVLGVGLDDPEQVAQLLEELGRTGAAALVVRAPVPLTAAVRRAADASGVALLGLSRGAPWAHLAAMLRSLLAEDDVGAAEEQSLGGLPSGDLFAVANAI